MDVETPALRCIATALLSLDVRSVAGLLTGSFGAMDDSHDMQEVRPCGEVDYLK